MKKSSLFFALPLLLLAASCAKEPIMEMNMDLNLIPLNIAGSIDQQHTKATADGFVDKDAIGLYAVNYTENNTVAGTLQVSGNQADNVKYVFDETNHKWTPVRPVYYKDINTNVDIYLYYPYQASISNITTGNFEVSKDQSSEKTATSLGGYEASDFLWGKKAGVVPSEASVGVKLSHKMAAVNLALNKGTGFESGEFENLSKSVILVNTTRKATIDYTTGTVTKLGGPQLDGIVMCPQNDGSFRAVVVPQSVAAGTNLFAITIGGISYGFSQNATVEYLAGKQLNANIIINKKTDGTGVELVLGDWQITEWTEDKNTHGGEARQYFVVNVSEPGTLGATIQAMGKNPDKIKNLKVVGNINDDDFSFMYYMAILEAVNLKESAIKGRKVIAACFTWDSNYSNYLTTYGEPDEIKDNHACWYEEDNGHLPGFGGKTTLCYIVFPEYVKSIGSFNGTSISGSIVIPDDVETIGNFAFSGTAITSIEFNNKLKSIGISAFKNCKSLSGKLTLPESLISIGQEAFSGCNFSGDLYLPEKLESIGSDAFWSAGNFSSGLRLPDKITRIEPRTFAGGTKFMGELDLNNCTDIASRAFDGCGFSGVLVIPEGVININDRIFSDCRFSTIIFPESLRKIDDYAFSNNTRLEKIEFKEGLISVGDNAITNANILSLELPSTLQTIQSSGFGGCYYLSKIICNAVEPPSIKEDTFSGVAKDNFTLEVPEQSIIRYQTETGWSNFKRITAHHDFSISRSRIRALNAEMQRTYILRCPANDEWVVSDKPDWITVSPSSGRGKTDVTISVSAMPRTDDMFEVNVGSFQRPDYKNYKGRKDTVVFCLSEKEYNCQLEVEQYDYDRYDGEVITHQTKTKGNGIDIVFIGEGYDAKDIVDGKFEDDCANGFTYFFNIEPYTTYKNYFNAYSVISQSDESGIETVNTILDNKFMKNGVLNVNAAFQWAKKADSNIDLSKTVVVLLNNSNNNNGKTYLYSDGSALSIVPHSDDAYPYDFRGILQHEAGGHNFGKLGEEYILHNAYITSCGCQCCDHPANEQSGQYGFYKSLGWFKNLSMYSNHNQVPWSHLIYHPTYSNRVDMYQGAYMHTRGIYRSEVTSCMNNNIPYFNTISRQAIVERIKEYAGETFDFEEFVAKDNFNVGTKSSVQNFDWTFGVDPKWNRGTEKGSIIYMGEHPNVK